jgi:hypothetical protein
MDHPDACPTPELLKAEHLTSGTTTDPWGVPYRIECEGPFISVRSSGPDRVLGNADDLIQPDDNHGRPALLGGDPQMR